MNIDILSVFLNTIKQIWFLIPIAVLVMIIKTPWFKGMMGELMVNVMSKLFLPKNTYHRVQNVTLPTDNNATQGTTQIDHIIVSRYGVFVVETKNMKGWIFGSSNQKTWTQKIYKHNHKFQNPLHQNFKHIKTLEYCLGLSENKLFSLVVFVGDNTFKTQMPDNVTRGYGYIRYIKLRKELLLSDYEVTSILQKIEASRLTRSFKTNREHVKLSLIHI